MTIQLVTIRATACVGTCSDNRSGAWTQRGANERRGRTSEAGRASARTNARDPARAPGRAVKAHHGGAGGDHGSMDNDNGSSAPHAWNSQQVVESLAKTFLGGSTAGAASRRDISTRAWLCDLSDEATTDEECATSRRTIIKAREMALYTEKTPSTGTITPDLRAMYSPQRQVIISRAAEDLARRLSSTCPQCQNPNFVAKQVTKGLPCELCNMPTEQMKSTTSVCDSCGFSHIETNKKRVADATYCQFCNP